MNQHVRDKLTRNGPSVWVPDKVIAAYDGGRTISASTAKKLHDGCDLAYRFEKIDGIEKPPLDIMVAGTLFDNMCSGDVDSWCEIAAIHWNVATIDLQDVVMERYKEYQEQINYDIHWQQVPVWRWVNDDLCYIGFADQIEITNEMSPDFPGDIPGVNQHIGTVSPVLVAITDRKLSKKPWPGTSAKSYYHKQAQCYIWAASSMLGCTSSPPPFFFDVVNLATPGLQRIPYKPTSTSIDSIPAWLASAWDKAQQQDAWEPELGSYKCKQCRYTLECDRYLRGEI